MLIGSHASTIQLLQPVFNFMTLYITLLKVHSTRVMKIILMSENAHC